MILENQISDIQLLKDGNIEITFCSADGIDFMTLKLDKHSMWQIHEFCRNKLSYAATKKGE